MAAKKVEYSVEKRAEKMEHSMVGLLKDERREEGGGSRESFV